MRKLLILLAAGLLTASPARASVPQQDDTTYRVAPKVPIKAYAFSLKDVRLLDGPFKKAMNLDAQYLLDLEPDRLLSRFREYAGLEPKGKIYGGWESRGVSGHILGHYLSACAMMYAASGDERFLDRVNYIVDELALCQQAHGNGYVGGIPDAQRIFAEVAAGDIKPASFGLNGGWVPWYTLHKLHAGLVDAYRHCDSEKAKTIVTALADWTGNVTTKLSDEKFQTMLLCEHGGMNEVLADIHAITGKQEYLDLAGRFNHRLIIDPLTRREDQLEGLHANTQVPKIIGAARQYELTANEDLRTAAAFFWEVVTQQRSYVNGGNSEAEHFRGKGELWKHLSPLTAETCNTYNMLKLTRHLFAWTADRRYADYYERALYNHILASQDPKKGMTIYFCSLEPGHFHTYSKPYDSFWCCTGSGLENHVKYGDSIYFHDDASLYVNLFIASELTWKAKGLKVRQETRFPDEPATRFALSCEKPVRIALKIRRPYWASSASKVTVNGQKVDVDGQSGGYLTIDRSWTDGDVVDVTLPMSLRVEPMANAPKKVAIMYGPIVLAGQLGREGFTDEMPYSGNQKAYANLPTPDVPVLVADGKPVEEWVERVPGKSLQFKTLGVGRPNDVSLIPFHEAHHQRFSVYWDLFTENDWQQKQAEYEAESLFNSLDPFYKQHVVTDGLLIVSSQKVSPYALGEVAYLVQKMLVNRPDLLEELAEKKMYVCIMAYNEMQTDLPECRGMSAWWDKRARGLGGRPVSCGEENVLCFEGDPYQGENIFIHEFAHGLHGAVASLDEQFNTRLRALHEKAKETGRFRGYGMGTRGEFWAEGVQSWFHCNRRGGLEVHDLEGEHVCHIDTREQLKEHLPELAKLLDEVFRRNEWTYVPVGKRPDEPHLRGYEPAEAPTFRWPAEVIEAFNRIEAERAEKRKD